MSLLRDLVPSSIQTRRLSLQLLNENNNAHWDCILRTINSKLAHETMGDMGLRTADTFVQHIQQYYVRDARFPDGVADQPFFYIIHLVEEPIGCVSVSSHQTMNGEWLAPDIGWGVREEFGGVGYATEAAIAFARMLSKDMEWDSIYCFPSTTNQRSNRVAEKMGFLPAGQVQLKNSPRPDELDNVLKLTLND